MDICFKYRNDFTFLKEANEIKVNVRDILDLTKLPKFAEGYPNQRIVAQIIPYEEFVNKDWLKRVNKELIKYNIAFCAEDTCRFDGTFSHYVQNYNFRHFFSAIVTDWEVLYGCIGLGVSDVYVGGSLGFELDKVKRICHRNGIKVRVIPDLCQTAWHGEEISHITSFWIRPEDLTYFEQYIDVLENYREDSTPAMEVYYNTYIKKREWTGNIKPLITGLPIAIDNRCILNKWAERRPICGRVCLKGSSCRICQYACNLAQKLEENKNYLVQGDSNDE